VKIALPLRRELARHSSYSATIIKVTTKLVAKVPVLRHPLDGDSPKGDKREGWVGVDKAGWDESNEFSLLRANPHFHAPSPAPRIGFRGNELQHFRGFSGVANVVRILQLFHSD
jgi:hypothetical protein